MKYIKHEIPGSNKIHHELTLTKEDIINLVVIAGKANALPVPATSALNRSNLQVADGIVTSISTKKILYNPVDETNPIIVNFTTN